jgi:hypothetical protein
MKELKEKAEAEWADPLLMERLHEMETLYTWDNSIDNLRNKFWIVTNTPDGWQN